MSLLLLRLQLLLLVAGGLQAWASTAVCSVYTNPNLGVNLFSYPSFSSNTPVIQTWTSVVGSALRLAQKETNGGTVGYAWHNERERIADGFISEFTFRINSGDNGITAGDGFTYFIQNDKISNLNGGTGDKLGSFGIGRSIAIKFDLCANRPTTVCAQQTMSLVMTNSSYATLLPNPTVPVPASMNLANGQVYKVKVVYAGKALGAQAKLLVQLESTTMFDIIVGDLATSLFNDRFAYFGFTASTSWSQTADIDVLSWSTDMAPSDTAVVGYTPSGVMQLDFGTTAIITVQLRDSCKNPLTSSGTEPLVVTSTLFQIPQSANINPLDYVTLVGNVTTNPNGTIFVSYNLPEYYQGFWDLSVQVNGVYSEGMPWAAGVQTVKPAPPTGVDFPVWALVLLILLILLIIAVLGYILYRLRRYKRKLKENAEFIEEGKQQAKLDRLEDGVKYQANPMVGTLDDLKDQLKKNEEELARLKALDELGSQQSFTIESLQKQRNELMEEMNRLKKEEQEEELKRKRQEEVVTAGSRAKKEFGREQVN
ncbi:hypothetical protein BASA81_002367 [Batrachochytrium salamandrivorans]|nr:hypothetical protein BASA81_002367 [Batrachochytrium salamandrivorans]